MLSFDSRSFIARLLLSKVIREYRSRGMRVQRWGTQVTEIAIAAQAKSPRRIQAAGADIINNEYGQFKMPTKEKFNWSIGKNAKLTRKNRSLIRRVDFNQGVDARILCKSKMFLQELSTTCIKPLRIAFDHLGLKKPYETAIRYSHEFGLDELSNYMLYNFHDSPSDLYERMQLNVKLNEELGIRIYSFPMRYHPTDRPD